VCLCVCLSVCLCVCVSVSHPLSYSFVRAMGVHGTRHLTRDVILEREREREGGREIEGQLSALGFVLLPPRLDRYCYSLIGWRVPRSLLGENDD